MAIDAQAPYRSLDGQVRKTETEYFARAGFSSVYRGIWEESPGRVYRVAIKVLRGVHTDGDVLAATRRRLDRESRVWLALNHPNVLPFFGVCSDLDAAPALVSPLCDYGEAVPYLRARPAAERRPIVVGTARGLEYLHTLGVVHGDLKGSNVLIDDTGAPRLCDFGRARIVGHRGFTTMFTGTARYLAPELIGAGSAAVEGAGAGGDGDDVVDEALAPQLSKETDVYAFGMLMLELLSGLAPYYYLKQDPQVMYHIAHGKTPRREKYELPPSDEALWGIMAACWARSAAERPVIGAVVRGLA